MAKILMVEDSAPLREAVSDFFMNRSGGTLTVETAADGDEGNDELPGEENED